MSLLDKMMRIAGRYDDGNQGQARAISVDENGNVNTKLTGSNMTYGTSPVYMGLAKLGTLKYSTVEQPLPIRPWRNDAAFSVIHSDAGTSTNISFGDGNGQINITTDLFDVTLLKVGDNVIVSGAGEANNNGTFEITAFTSDRITVDHATTEELAGATVTVSMKGDIVSRQGGDDLDNYTFDDTSTTPANVLQWHMFYDIIDGKPSLIYIADRNLIGAVRWNEINGSDFIFGKNVTIDGNTYLCRSLTGGVADRDGQGSAGSFAGGLLPNEWDRYMMNGIDDGGAIFTGAPEPENDDYLSGDQNLNNTARRREHNRAWHWNAMLSLCQEAIADDSSSRPRRGASSARYWRDVGESTLAASFGFRPVLVKELEGGV